MEAKKYSPQEKLDKVNRYSSNIEVWYPAGYFSKVMKNWGAFTCVIAGSSKSGKSSLLKDLMIGDCKLRARFDIVVIFSRTLINGFYQEFMGTKLMFKEFRPDVLEKLKLVAETCKSQGKKFKWLIIFDDIADARSKYQEDVTDIFFSGRHYGASIIFLTQKCSLMNTGWIANTMVFVSLFAGSRNEKNYLSEKVISDVIDKDFSDFTHKDVERAAYTIQTAICDNFNSLVVLPYESRKLFQYKATLQKNPKKKPFEGQNVLQLDQDPQH